MVGSGEPLQHNAMVHVYTISMIEVVEVTLTAMMSVHINTIKFLKTGDSISKYSFSGVIFNITSKLTMKTRVRFYFASIKCESNVECRSQPRIRKSALEILSFSHFREISWMEFTVSLLTSFGTPSDRLLYVHAPSNFLLKWKTVNRTRFEV